MAAGLEVFFAHASLIILVYFWRSSGNRPLPKLSKLSCLYKAPGMPLDNFSPYRLWPLPSNGIRLLGGFDRVRLSPRTQLFRGLAIAAVVCGGGGRTGVRGVDVLIRS